MDKRRIDAEVKLARPVQVVEACLSFCVGLVHSSVDDSAHVDDKPIKYFAIALTSPNELHTPRPPPLMKNHSEIKRLTSFQSAYIQKTFLSLSFLHQATSAPTSDYGLCSSTAYRKSTL